MPQTLQLTETPTLSEISEEYFYRMLSPTGLMLAKPFTQEEDLQLTRTLQNHSTTKDMNFIAVGGGELWSLRQALTYTKHYICIEPLGHFFVNDSVRYLLESHSEVTLIDKPFDQVARKDLPIGQAFYMFLFNILAYIENPVEVINQHLQQGDVLFLTTWARTPEARKVRRQYFNYLNKLEDEVIIDPEKTTGLCNFDEFPFEKLAHFTRSERHKGTITDILVIYT